MENYLPLIAYTASGFILVSFLMKDMIVLRTLNTIGALMFLYYAYYKNDTPIMFINGTIAVINLVYIYKLTRK
jgi:hypothetical protein